MRLLGRRRPPRNVFVLGTGRCGTTAVAEACKHLTNYTAGHETRTRLVGVERLSYPDRHVEVDNRLAWFLGGLDQRYGHEPLYVHLRRDPEKVARSFLQRWDTPPVSIIKAFHQSLLVHGRPWPEDQRLDVCRYYVETVTANIELFLRDKPNQMTVWLEEAADWFPAFWNRIGGRGDLDASMAEFGKQHAATGEDPELRRQRKRAQAERLKPS